MPIVGNRGVANSMQAEDETKVVNRESILAEASAPDQDGGNDEAKNGAPLRAAPVSVAHLDLLASSRLVGRYEVIHRLGHGGMATVYVGRAIGTAGFERLVAVKVIHPHLAREPEFVEMFLDEARIAAKIHDPNVVEIIDLGEDDGLFFMVMEYVEGETLSALLRQLQKSDAKLPLTVALQIAIDGCRGLAAAHELQGNDGSPLDLVHRDVSPHNLLVSMNGRLKVVDFGIMKAAGKRSNTLTGQLRGKIAYMSPEQARGQRVDQRTDIFAMGAVFWEMCTNERLFGGEAEAEVLEQVLKFKGPSEREQFSSLHEGVASLLEKSLAPNPEDRYATAREFVADARALMRQIQGDAEPREQLAAAMAKHFGARVEYVRATIRGHAANERRDGSSGTLSNTEFAGSTPARTILGPSLTPAPLATGTLTSTLSGDGRRSWLSWLLLPALGAAIGVAVMSSKWGDQPAQPREPVPLAAAEPAKEPEPEPEPDPDAALVTWWFNTDPQGATIYIDGEQQEKPTPLAVKLAKGSDTVLVRVEHEGYTARELRMAPLGPENHSLRLEQLPGAVSPGQTTPLHFTARPPAGRKGKTLPKKQFKATPAKGAGPDEPSDAVDGPKKPPQTGDDRTLEDMPNFGGAKTTAN